MTLHTLGVVPTPPSDWNLSEFLMYRTQGGMRQSWREVSVGEKSQAVNIQAEEAVVASLAHTANIPTQGFASSEPVPHGEGLASPQCVLGIGSRHGRAHVNHTCPLGTSSNLYTFTPGFLSCQHLNGRQNELRLWTVNRS